MPNIMVNIMISDNLHRNGIMLRKEALEGLYLKGSSAIEKGLMIMLNARDMCSVSGVMERRCRAIV